jgi:dienelactone hydrolase
VRRRIGRGRLTLVVTLVNLAMVTGVGAPTGRADGVRYPAQSGPLAVAVRTSERIPIEEDLRGPEGAVPEVVTDFYLPADPGPWPVVVFSPGTCDTKANFTNWGPPLASRGFVVVVPNRRMAVDGLVEDESGLGQCLAQDPRINSEDLLRILQWVADEGANQFSFLYGKVDRHRLGIVGHSLGGTFAALAAARFSNPDYFQDAAPRDYRKEMTLRAVVLLDPGRYFALPKDWAPEFAATSISTPTAVLAGRPAAPPPDPTAPKYSDIFTPFLCEASAEHPRCLLVPRATFAALSDSVPKLGMEVVGATHFEPADPDTVDADFDVDTLSFPPRTGTERQLLFRRYSMAWLGFWLGCDRTALPFLDGPAAEADQTDGKIILFDGNTSFPAESLPAVPRC